MAMGWWDLPDEKSVKVDSRLLELFYDLIRCMHSTVIEPNICRAMENDLLDSIAKCISSERAGDVAPPHSSLDESKEMIRSIVRAHIEDIVRTEGWPHYRKPDDAIDEISNEIIVKVF